MSRKDKTFDRFVAEQLKSPSFAREFERAGVEVRAIDELIRGIDAARIELGMTKADLARRVSTTPEAMRRLLTSPDANPTFTTILHVLEAVEIGLSLHRLPKRPEAARARQRHRQIA
jgi:DNA-binding phage protein